MRIAFTTQWFPPEPGAVISAAMADGLSSRGHDIDVLTGFPNYPSGKLHTDYPLRRYRRDKRSERVTVHRSPLYPSHDGSPVRRAANYLSFSASAAWTARSRLQSPDVWLTYSSPATAAIPALTAPARMSAPSCLIIQDLWPDSVTDSGFVGGVIGRGLNRTLTTYCDWSYRKSSAIGIIAPSMRTILIDRGVEPEKIHFTPNWIDDQHLLPDTPASDELRHSLGLPTGRLFMYAGNLGRLQNLAPLIEAFAHCPSSRLALVGDGIAKTDLMSLVRMQGIRNVVFVDAQSTADVGRFIAASDVQIVSLKDSTLLRATVPSKLQTSMAAGRPILAHAVGDVADIVVSSGAGLSVQPGNCAATGNIIDTLNRMPAAELSVMGRASRAYYERHYSPQAGIDRLEGMLIAAAESAVGSECTNRRTSGMASR